MIIANLTGPNGMLLPASCRCSRMPLPLSGVLSGWLALFTFVTSATAEPPELLGLFPLGGRRGATSDVTVTISAGSVAKLLWFSHPGITAQPITGNRFAVNVAADVPEGDYDAWLVTSSGLTNPRRFAVGSNPELIEIETPLRNDSPAMAQNTGFPITMNGLIDPGTDRDCFRFSMDDKQRFTARCRSARLEGTVAPVLSLFDPARGEVRHVVDNLAEPVFDYRTSRAGAYVVQVEDLAYRKGAHSAYRLELFAGPRLVAAFPNTLAFGQPQTVTLYGYDLPGGEPAGPAFPMDLQQLSVRVTAPQAGDADGGGWTLTSAALLSGFMYRHPDVSGRVRFGLVEREVTLEQDAPHPTREVAQQLPVPVEFSGRFLKTGEVDWYRFSAAAGQLLWIEAVAERAEGSGGAGGGSSDGTPMDLELAIHDASGKLVETFSDTAHAKEYPAECPLDSLDPSGTWKVPAEGEYLLAVRDLYGSINSKIMSGYRLSISPRHEEVSVVALPAKMDKPGGLAVAPGRSSEWLLVAVRRGGQQHPIRIRAENLPPGLEVADMVIGDKQFAARISLKAAADAAAWVGKLVLVAETEVDGRKRSFAVRSATYLRDSKPLRARLTDGLAAAIVRE